MKLKDYFENTKGIGVLSTADNEGTVDAAIFSRPHVFEEGTIAFVMRDRLTYHNLQSNGHAHFLFIEESPGYRGVRLFLTKVGEEKDSPLADELKRPWLTPEEDKAKGPKYLVTFRIDKQLPLIGAGSQKS
jgi:hypothetical protein